MQDSTVFGFALKSRLEHRYELDCVFSCYPSAKTEGFFCETSRTSVKVKAIANTYGCRNFKWPAVVLLLCFCCVTPLHGSKCFGY